MLEVLAKAIRVKKKKNIQIKREELELSLFTDDTIMCADNCRLLVKMAA